MKTLWGMAALLLLSACSTPDTALQLAREQQALQMAAREAEARTAAGEVASDAQVYLSMIRRLQQDGRYFASLAHIDSYQNRYGMTPELAVLRADALRVTEQLPASEAAYRELLGGPLAATGWHGLGLLAGAGGDFAKAAGFLAKAVELEPTNVDMLNDLGFARLRSGDRVGARLPLAQAAELAPTNAKVLANLALLLTIQGDRERAVQMMDRVSMPDRTRMAVSGLAEEILAIDRLNTAGSARAAVHAAMHGEPSADRGWQLPVLEAAPTLSLFERMGQAKTISQ